MTTLSGGPTAAAVLAARNNAEWCRAVCASHGIASRIEGGIWSAQAPTPVGYPEAVTLAPGIDAAAIVAALPVGASSIKDSFADVDLTPFGFEVLFDATWIIDDGSSTVPTGGAQGSTRPSLEAIRTPSDLATWAWAHGLRDAFAPALLDDPDIVILGARGRGGEFVAGAVLNRTEEVVGLSNVFDGGSELVASARDEAGRRWPGRPIVGYEDGEALDAALAAGFRTVGPLRVWHRRAAGRDESVERAAGFDGELVGDRREER